MTELEPAALVNVGQAVPELVAGAAGGLVGYALGGPVGAATGGAVTPAMVAGWNLCGLALVRRLSRGSRALEIAADELDVGLDILAERATADDARLELLARVLEAAGRTPLEKKIPALGHVLAGGLREDGDVDEALMLVGALDDLEAPHVRALDVLGVLWSREGQDDEELVRSRSTDDLLAAIGSSLALPGVLSVLVRHGLATHRTISIEEDRGDGTSRIGDEPEDETWELTPLGGACLDFLLDGRARHRARYTDA